MSSLVSDLKQSIITLVTNKTDFIHHEWFVEYHLLIVEKLALELCDQHPSADRDIVLAMVWMHDYGKIIDFANQYTVTLTTGEHYLCSLGFTKEFARKVITNIERLDKKENLFADDVPIEIKIVSSADGASHLIGPFFYMWWHENPQKPFRQLMADNFAKSEKDWNKKVVLPEVREAFKDRRHFFLEQVGQFPEKFLS
jgi:hypothetical protein